MRATEVKTYEFLAGTDIREAISEAIEIAKKEGCIVNFKFNGVDMRIFSGSDIDEEIKHYYKKLWGEK